MATAQIARKHPLAKCEECPLARKDCAKTTGPSDAKLAVVSRSPGYHEAMAGKSFSGPSGKVLDHLLALQGVTREQVITTNVVLCQTDASNAYEWERAVIACKERLLAEIDQAETVIAAGTEATGALLGTSTIATQRGYPHVRATNSGNKQTVIVTNNPAMVLRDDRSYPELVRDFRLAINPLPKPKLPTVKWIEDIEQAKLAAKEMLGQFEVIAGSFYADTEKLVACDIEARGNFEDGQQQSEQLKKRAGLAHTAEVVCAGFSIRPERAVVFGEAPCYDDSFRKDFLKPLYEVDGLRYLWHNGKYDTKVLRTSGISARVDEDTLLLSWALDERPGDPESGAGGHSIEWLLKDELGWPKYEPEIVKHFKKTGELPDKQARIQLYQYNGMDTAGTIALFNILQPQAINDSVWERPYRSLLVRLSEALTKVELQGNLFDADEACNILEANVWPRLAELLAKARQISGLEKLNLNSPLQLGKLIYDEWGVKHNLQRPKIERKGKRSTDVKVREEILRGDYICNTERVHPTTVHAFVETYNFFKQLDKQRGTYLEGLVLRRFPNGRIYTDFKIHGTESGRLSSSNPNMQNITRPKEGLPNIRSAFVADPGCVFVSADFSQAELRTIAVLSGDENLRSIYLDSSRSLHKEVARKFYGDDYTYEQYVRAKNINFGVAYWQSAFSFAQLYHMPVDEAQAYIDFWWERFPQVWEWTKSIEKQVTDLGELQSPFGHKRRFYVIPSDESARLHMVKQGINFLPQNIAGNLTNYATCRLTEELDPRLAQVRITVHDNIVVNARQDHLNEVAYQLKTTMEAAAKESIGWDFPYLVDISYGERWGNLHDWEPQG